MRNTPILGIVFAVLVLIQGCAPGYNSIVFATKSNLGLDANVGIDADTAPANLEIAISRHEGVLMPAFEGGKTVPVMGSFLSESDAFTRFFWGVKSTFSTGEAAYIMSYLYDGADADKVCYKPVTLSQEPKPQLFGYEIEYLKKGDAKPVLFGTDTILGIKVKWSGQTAQFPSSVNIGFKRREAAWAPIGVSQVPIPQSSNSKDAAGTSYEVDVPSLLATVDTNLAADASAKFKYLQYFATGSAASNLARRRAVREAMLQRSDPVQAKLAEEGIKRRENNWKYIKQIRDKCKAAPEEKKTAIMKKAKELKLIDESVANEKDFFKTLGEHSDALSPIPSKLEELAKFASE